MKKLFISLVAVAFSISAMATNTAAARIKLVGSNTTYAVSTLFLNEDDARNNTYESGYDAESMMSQSNPLSVLIYAYVGTHPCERVETNNLDGQAISITTNKVDANYTLQFSNVSGRALNLYDKVTKTFVDITEGGSYAFSVEAAQVGQHEVKDRFVINYEVVPSFCFNYNVLEVNGHAGEALVIKQGATEIINIPSLPILYSYDLSAYNGRLVVTLNGKDYQIDANPAVTEVP